MVVGGDVKKFHGASAAANGQPSEEAIRLYVAMFLDAGFPAEMAMTHAMRSKNQRTQSARSNLFRARSRRRSARQVERGSLFRDGSLHGSSRDFATTHIL